MVRPKSYQIHSCFRIRGPFTSTLGGCLFTSAHTTSLNVFQPSRDYALATGGNMVCRSGVLPLPDAIRTKIQNQHKTTCSILHLDTDFLGHELQQRIVMSSQETQYVSLLLKSILIRTLQRVKYIISTHKFQRYSPMSPSSLVSLRSLPLLPSLSSPSLSSSPFDTRSTIAPPPRRIKPSRRF